MRARIVLCFAIIYVVWGSTFLAIRLGVRDLPPLLFAAGRSYMAGILLIAVAAMLRERFPATTREWRAMVFFSLLMITFSNGPTTLALTHIPSNEAALLSSCLALWMAGLGAIGPHGHKLTLRSIVGLLLGLLGVALLVWPRDAAPSGHFGWQVLIILGGLSWSVGTIMYRNMKLTVGPLAFNGVMMLFGATGLLLGGIAAGELPRWHWEANGLVAMVYLAVFGSAIAYTAYSWLIQRVTMDKVSTFAYVNPAIATVLGWAVLGESLGPLQIAGTIVILLGVALVTAA